MNWQAKLDAEGYAIVKNVLDEATVNQLCEKCDVQDEKPHIRRRAAVYGIRNLLDEVPEVRALAKSAAVRAVVEPVLGKTAFCARGIFYDKPADANWQVPWHQDLAIAVAEREEDVPEFTVWSLKAGVHHVQPPAGLLERMLTVRLHLDDAGKDNGALQVLVGSHREGRMDAAAVRAWRKTHEPVYCEAAAGDAMVMRPLLLHASDHADHALHRRVIHLEFAAEVLPAPLEWHERVK